MNEEFSSSPAGTQSHPFGAGSRFPQGPGDQGIARRRTLRYAKPEIPQIDAEIA